MCSLLNHDVEPAFGLQDEAKFSHDRLGGADKYVCGFRARIGNVLDVLAATHEVLRMPGFPVGSTDEQAVPCSLGLVCSKLKAAPVADAPEVASNIGHYGAILSAYERP